MFLHGRCMVVMWWNSAARAQAEVCANQDVNIHNIHSGSTDALFAHLFTSKRSRLCLTHHVLCNTMLTVQPSQTSATSSYVRTSASVNGFARPRSFRRDQPVLALPHSALAMPPITCERRCSRSPSTECGSFSSQSVRGNLLATLHTGTVIRTVMYHTH